MNKNTMVKFVDGKVAPTARRWLADKNMLPLFHEAEPFLYFLDKYGTIMVGGAKAMGKYYKANKGKTLLDKLTVSDIAYIMVYENSYDVWMEETVKSAWERIVQTHLIKKMMMMMMTVLSLYRVKTLKMKSIMTPFCP